MRRTPPAAGADCWACEDPADTNRILIPPSRSGSVYRPAMSVINQAGCAIIVCYSCLTMALMYAWPSSTIKLFSSANTTLHRPMSENEIALFGSFSSISAIFTTPFSGILLDRIGRKNSCILFSLPQVVAWLIVSISSRVEAVLSAMFISGFGGCTLLLAPVFVSEFCQESVRGMMTSGSVIAYGLGILLSYLLGGCLEFNTMIYMCLSMSVLAVLLLWPLKESPLFLMKNGLENDAMKAVAFYRRVKETSKEVTQEINTLKRALKADLEDVFPEEEKLKPESKKQEKVSKWKFLKKSRSTRQALFVALALYSATMFQGLVAIQVYAEPVFEETLPNISSTLSCVLLAVVSVVSSCVAAYLIDIAGRRPLMIYSSIGAGICCVALGTQINLPWGPHWITGVFIYLFAIMYTLGAGTVPYVFVAEVFLPEVKSLVSMLSAEWAWICNFIILYIFIPLVSSVGLAPVFYIFGGVCFATAMFCTYLLPETKGLSVDVIQTLLVKSKRVQSVTC
ncbi:unnamed protein product [Parnassius apollo]|uniref:(apollo) hypothetical protein n=1 Tax=Parnassius apollo TaxID=110799 RepID=A0A8S3WCW1_PARAO|nr:unnamed protein product [Parnassius apollo]